MKRSQPFEKVREMLDVLKGAPVSFKHVFPNHEERTYYRRHKKRGPYKPRKPKDENSQ